MALLAVSSPASILGSLSSHLPVLVLDPPTRPLPPTFWREWMLDVEAQPFGTILLAFDTVSARALCFWAL
jgi:hypothetical protein